jgi:hypothetical protein
MIIIQGLQSVGSTGPETVFLQQQPDGTQVVLKLPVEWIEEHLEHVRDHIVVDVTVALSEAD